MLRVLSIASAMMITSMAQAQEPVTSDFKMQRDCLAMNIYHEARSESRLSQKAVAMVTLNRVESERYPNTVCDVIYQSHHDSRGNPIRNKCQFSWYCDGKSDKPKDKDTYAEIETLANELLLRYPYYEDFTEGSTMYHANYVVPYWAKNYSRVVQIDSHIFYK